MIRSARKARWCGFTSQVRFFPAQPEAASSASRTILEKDREATGKLLELLGVVGAEDHVVAKVGAQRDALLEGYEQPAPDVGHGVVAGVDRVEVGLLAPLGPAAAAGHEQGHRRGGPQVEVGAAAVIEHVGLLAHRLADEAF